MYNSGTREEMHFVCEMYVNIEALAIVMLSRKNRW